MSTSGAGKRSGAGERSGARRILLFVDRIDGGGARILVGDAELTLPLSVLPVGVREGDWVQMDVGIIDPPPSDTEERRRRLAKTDPGGPLKL